MRQRGVGEGEGCAAVGSATLGATMTKSITSVTLLALGLFFLTAATPALAASAPAQLQNKTITVSWTTSANLTAPDGRQANRSMAVSRIIYVSSQGRVFVRTSRNTGVGSDSTDRGPGETAGTYRFEGGRIVGFNKMFGGANLVSISFDGNFQSCNASVQVGRSAGEGYKTKAPNGQVYAISGTPTYSGVSCSIKSGNPFAE